MRPLMLRSYTGHVTDLVMLAMHHNSFALQTVAIAKFSMSAMHQNIFALHSWQLQALSCLQSITAATERLHICI